MESGITVKQVSIQDGRVTSVALDFTNYNYIAVGSSICHPNDTFDADLGYELAYGRALADAAKYFKSNAWAKVPR